LARELSRRKARKARRRAPPGSPPGTLIADPEAPPPAIYVMAYGPGAEEFEERPIAEPEHLRGFLGKWPVIWVNVDGLGDAAVLRRIGEVFGLHQLTMEDIINVHQRPKLEHYDSYQFLVARMATLGERLETEQLSLLLGRHFVLTFQERAGDGFGSIRERIRKKGGRLRSSGPDYLAYSLLDAVLDGYFPVLEACGELLEALEDEVIGRPQRGTISRIHGIKRDLLTIRRVIWPQREAFNALVRDPTPLVSEETRLYFRDCYDHTIQVMDLVETYRELGSGLLDVYMSSISNRMNDIIKILTIFSTIFIPLTFIAGVYGMNFNSETSPLNMPELGWYWGYPFALGLMLAVALTLLVFFWRRGWFSRIETRESNRIETK
jgi:magnesium transporter